MYFVLLNLLTRMTHRSFMRKHSTCFFSVPWLFSMRISANLSSLRFVMGTIERSSSPYRKDTVTFAPPAFLCYDG